MARWHDTLRAVQRGLRTLLRALLSYKWLAGSYQAKTVQPLTLMDCRKRSEIEARAKKVPGLHICRGGPEWNFDFCIGWDLSALYELAERISCGNAPKRAEERKVRVERSLNDHRALVDKLKWDDDVRKLTKSDKMGKASGTYVVQCDDLLSTEDGCGFELRIEEGASSGLLEGEFEFGQLCGRMLLSFSKRYLDSYVEKGAWPKLDDEESDSDDSDDVEVGEPDVAERDAVAGTRKRKSATHQPRRGKARGGQQKKNKKKVTWENPNRLYLRFRGEDDDYKPYQTKGGHLEFSDSKCLDFKGFCVVGIDGKEISFGGFKTWEFCSSSAPIARPCLWWGTYDKEN